MAETVYVLCALTSMLCAALLIRSWTRSRSPLLLWSSLCFTALAINNALLFVDLVIMPSMDLAELRSAIALVGIAVLIFGLVWERR